MLEDQVAFFLQKYLGNYVRGLNKEALKISVWKGDVELTNMQLRPEALNALQLPVRVKAGFLGSVRLKVPWSRLGQEPVLVYLDRIFILAEPATQVEGHSEDALQEAKKTRVRELEMKLLESQQQLKSEMNTSWLGSLINTIIGNLKLSITNIHIRYEDIESNPGHPFAAGLTLANLSAVTVDDSGKETFATGGDLDRIQKSVELQRLAVYFDSDSSPWKVDKPWEDSLPSEWCQIFELGKEGGRGLNAFSEEHSYMLEPVTGNAKYTKMRLAESIDTRQALQKAAVDLDNVTLSLSKNGYMDIMKMADNFSAFNQRLKYAHYRPPTQVKSDPKSWWKYAYKVVTDEMKKASGKLSWEQVLRYARLRKKYISLYASLLKSDMSRLIADENEEIENLDRELDIEVILQWRMLAHKLVEQSAQSDLYPKQNPKRSWWSFGWTGSAKEETESKGFAEEDWERLNKFIGYKENSDEYLLSDQDKNLIQFSLEVRMKHNASKLIIEGSECLAELSCEEFLCNLNAYTEAKTFDLKLGSYRLSSPYGLLAESATVVDSLLGVFSYKPLDAQVDWSFVAKASPCYVTYLKESIDQIVDFFKSSSDINQSLALGTVAAMQMTIDEVRRTAQQQVTQALKDQSRFSLDLDIAAPKITIPTKFRPDGFHETKLLLDLGNFLLRTEELWDSNSSEEEDIYLQFNLVLSDVSAFLVDGNYRWSEGSAEMGLKEPTSSNLLPVIDKCGIVVKLQQIQSENPLYPSTRLAVRLPSLGFHFSPARYHRLMQVAKIFEDKDTMNPDVVHPWNQADFEGWLSLLSWKGVGNREAVWQHRYFCLVGPYLYVLESPNSTTYKQCVSLRGKQVHQVSTELTGGLQNILALYDSGQSNPKVLEDVNAVILLCDNDEVRKTWHNRLQGAIYRASGSAAIPSLSETSSPHNATEYFSHKGSRMLDFANMEKLFVAGVLDELKICFSCCYQTNQVFKKMLLSKESNLFEFRALGGEVELSMKESNIIIGTILRSLEIEDQYFSTGLTARYLARSFIDSVEDTSMQSISSSTTSGHNISSESPLKKNDSVEDFFEASDRLDDPTENSVQRQSSMSEYFSAQPSLPSPMLSLRPPSFSRIPGLLPDAELETKSSNLEKDDTLRSFVKAQLVIYNQNSAQYRNLDNRVIITLATLTFFCHRPTILAIMEFANAINFVDDNHDGEDTDTPSTSVNKDTTFEEPNSSVGQDLAIRGLFGRGKSRVIFHLTLNMAKAQILLMNENGNSLATLSQNNLLTEIKVFPSSFNIKAALGNLKISDDSLPSSHSYFWICDMRNPGGSSFVEIDFSSFSRDDQDYCGFDYSLVGHLSEVRIVYLNRFVQEIISYFMGLVPQSAETVVKLKDHVTDSEKWVSKTDIEGSPALKLDLSLSRPVILMPRKTDSLDYLELDVLFITIQNTFQWIGSSRDEMNAIHLEILTIKVKDINLTVGIDMVSGESIIQDVKGFSLIVHRSLRDLLHQVPTVEAAIEIEVLKASLSNREYQIITECALSNFSETQHPVPSLGKGPTSSNDAIIYPPSLSSETANTESMDNGTWITMRFSAVIHLVELSLHSGLTRDSSLAGVQATGAWLLYKSNANGEGFLFATLKGFSVFDNREGTKEELRLAIGKSATIKDTSHFDSHDAYLEPLNNLSEREVQKQIDLEPIPSMLILDATLKKSATNVSLCVQRPKFLVALDFLLAVVEFFVPSVHNMLSNEEEEGSLLMLNAVVFDGQIYSQASSTAFLSPRKPLIVDDEQFDHFIYDGEGGKLYLQDRTGKILCAPSPETFIYVGNGKRLQFRNVTIMSGDYLDSCISLGTNSSYSASEDDHVYLERKNIVALSNSYEEKAVGDVAPKSVTDESTEFVMELQAIGPELTFYSTSKFVSEPFELSTKVMHAHLDLLCRIVLKGDSLEMCGNILGLKVDSNSIRVLEPFDTTVKYSNTSGKTNMHVVVSEIYMNFSFSILKLLLAVEEDIMAFLRMSSKKVSVVCSQFDKVGTMRSLWNDHSYAFWRPRAPSGYAILGDCFTPLNEPPSKGVLAVNTSLVRVRRPVAYKLIWRTSELKADKCQEDWLNALSFNDNGEEYNGCSIWFPIAPKGYVSIGCVVSAGSVEPSLSSALCVLASMVSLCSLKDCIALRLSESSLAAVAFWRVDNSFGSFLPGDLNDLSLVGKPYDLRCMIFRNSESSGKISRSSVIQDIPRTVDRNPQLERSALLTSGGLFDTIASFKLIWWNHGLNSQKKLSIWRPTVPHGLIYLGDLAVDGYEHPNSSLVLRDTGDETLLRAPHGFQLVGHIKKQRGIDCVSFWYPQAPPGFVALGCIASKGPPKVEDFTWLRCIRNDMVTGDQFPEESIWDTSDSRVSEHFSLWSLGNNLGTFLVRSGFRKPPRRFALKLAGQSASTGSDSTVIDAEIKTFSAVAYDDYGGLMVPLFGTSFDNISFSLHGRPDYVNATANFSLAARSFNDRYDSWEPLIEPMDGFLRYQYDMNTPGALSLLRMTSTRDLNLNISVANANMMFQAYSSWNNLSHIDESYKKKEAVSPPHSEKSILDVHHRKNYYIIPLNKLGQDIYMRAIEFDRVPNIIRMPSGDDKPIKVPVSKNLLDSHSKWKPGRVFRSMVTVIIADAELTMSGGLATSQYMTAVRLFSRHPAESPLQQQSARTCAATVDRFLHGSVVVNWGEMFFFKVDAADDFILEFIVIDVGRGEPVGICSAPLKQVACELPPTSDSYDANFQMTWRELASAKPMMHENDDTAKSHGRIRSGVFLSVRPENEKNRVYHNTGRRTGYIQISPAREGPWTTVRLNYAAPAACWRLGNDVIASEVTVKDGNRYVNIRSLVSVTNNTDFIIAVSLKGRSSSEHPSLDGGSQNADLECDDTGFKTDELFELEIFDPSSGWVHCPSFASGDQFEKFNTNSGHQGPSNVKLPDGWEWTDDWHVDRSSVGTADGWVYASDTEHLKWPESLNKNNSLNYARQRRWIRHRKYIAHEKESQISVGVLSPGDTAPLPLSALTHSAISYQLQLRPQNSDNSKNYTWSIVQHKENQTKISSSQEELPEISVSELSESDKLLFCSQLDGSSSDVSRGLWFSASIRAKEIGKDIHSDPINDWNIIIKSPLSLIYYLPFSAQYAISANNLNGEDVPCSQGPLCPGRTVKIHNADLRDPLYLSLVPQGWEMIHDPVPISDPTGIPAKFLNLRNSISGRVVQIILEQNYDKDRLIARTIRIYVPYWISSSRCPPLIYRVVDMSAKKERRHSRSSNNSDIRSEKILWQVTQEEMIDGYSIVSGLNFKLLGISASISRHGKECFGPVKELSPLGDMDGSVELFAYDTDGSCMRVLVSSKPSLFQAVPTKVIFVRPFMTFTNRVGQDLFIKLNAGDHPKTLCVSDWRVSFIYSEAGGSDQLQVRLADTEWCLPVEIVKEDIITILLRKQHGGRQFLKTEIRGYEEGSRFLIVFRLGSADGPIRIENRVNCMDIHVRQSGLDENAWIHLSPLSTTKFAWENPYGERLLDVTIQSGDETFLHCVDMEKPMDSCAELRAHGIRLRVVDYGDIKILQFADDRITAQVEQHEQSDSNLIYHSTSSSIQSEMQSSTAPLELIVELGVIGVSLVDHRPRELLYLYLERVFISYSTGYDSGRNSRFKLIIGLLQLDNQLPLALTPVLLAPEGGMPDVNHPVFKATITISNETADGTEVYPYVYIRVTEKCWRINIHEPIIWALVDFYNNLRIDSIPSSSSVTQVDPEVRIGLIDISEVRFKISLDTAPTERPPGVLGIWSPVLSAIGNAFKIQVHLRKVMHKNRSMRKSAIVPAIVNRIKRDLIHNPLHLIFSVDVLGMTKSTLASLSKGFAELSTDGQFLQLRSKQVWSRRITGVGDGILQGTEAFAQGVAFGVSGVLTKPVENARQHGLLGFAHGLGRAFLGFVVQPLSGALDFVSLTVDGISASFVRCLEIISKKSVTQRIRNPRAIRADGVIREYSRKEAVGQMVLYLAEASTHLGCTDLFREPSKYAWSDYYEDHFLVSYQRIVLVTNKRVMLLQCLDVDKMDRKPSKIIWDIPWEELLALELAKVGYQKPSHLIIHLKDFRRSESFVRLIRCIVNEDEEHEPQAVIICSSIRKMWKAYQAEKSVSLKVPSSQRHVEFAWDDMNGRGSHSLAGSIIKKGRSSSSADMRFVKHTVIFPKIWSSEQEIRRQCTLFAKQVADDGTICSIWRPQCPDGYISIGDVAHIGNHSPHVAAIYRNSDGNFALPIGYDLVWRNCIDDYDSPVSIWLPRPPDGYVTLGCVALANYEEPPLDLIYCASERIVEETSFEEQPVWTALGSYPWACYIYQVQSAALQFVALRQRKEESDWRPLRISESDSPQLSEGPSDGKVSINS